MSETAIGEAATTLKNAKKRIAEIRYVSTIAA